MSGTYVKNESISFRNECYMVYRFLYAIYVIGMDEVIFPTKKNPRRNEIIFVALFIYNNLPMLSS